MIKLRLKKDQNGYKEVGKLVNKFWFVEKGIPSTTIVELEMINALGNDIDYYREICYPDGFCGNDITWIDDWWEGQQNINVLSISSIDDLDLSKGVIKDE